MSSSRSKADISGLDPEEEADTPWHNPRSTVDHGQVVKYLGDRAVETAKNGLLRVGSHSRYGFGELRLKPLDEQYQETKQRANYPCA